MNFRSVLSKGILAVTATVLISVSAQAQYCAPPATILVSDDVENFITNVTITGTTLNHTTTSVPVDGYLLVPATPASNTATLNVGNSYTISLTYNAIDVIGIGMWIDYNQNTSFDPNEYVSVPLNSSGVTTANFTVPASAVTGATRMRLMASEEIIVGPTNSCSDLDDGEVEDYTVTIAGGSGQPCNAPTGLAVTNTTTTSATLNWNGIAGATGYQYSVSTSNTIPSAPGTPTTDTFAVAGQLQPATAYYLHVRSQCDSVSFSTWTSLAFNTGTTGVEAVGHEGFSLQVYPNPVTDVLSIEFPEAPLGEYRVSLADIYGRSVYKSTISTAKGNLDLSELANGVYILAVECNGSIYTTRVVKQ